MCSSDLGRIVAQGPPEQVARNKKSYTGQVLARVLNGNFLDTKSIKTNDTLASS